MWIYWTCLIAEVTLDLYLVTKVSRKAMNYFYFALAVKMIPH